MNIRSLKINFASFIAEIQNIIVFIDVIVLVETNIEDTEECAFQIPDFDSRFYNRENRREGGIVVYCRSNIKNDILPMNTSSFESLVVEIGVDENKITLVAIYRPPSTYNTEVFTGELETFLRQISSKHDVITIGDINIDILKENKHTLDYLEMYSTLGFQNCNPFEITREDLARNTTSNIDHVLVRGNHITDIKTFIVQTLISDHFSIFFHATLKSKRPKPRSISDETRYMNGKLVGQLIRSHDWTILTNCNDPTELYNKLLKLQHEQKHAQHNCVC